jgi:hypothetical protein
MQALHGRDHTLVTFSDAHEPGDIGCAATRIDADAFTLSALCGALLARRATPVFRES